MYRKLFRSKANSRYREDFSERFRDCLDNKRIVITYYHRKEQIECRHEYQRRSQGLRRVIASFVAVTLHFLARTWNVRVHAYKASFEGTRGSVRILRALATPITAHFRHTERHDERKREREREMKSNKAKRHRSVHKG